LNRGLRFSTSILCIYTELECPPLEGRKATQAIQSILCCAYITTLPVIFITLVPIVDPLDPWDLREAQMLQICTVLGSRLIIKDASINPPHGQKEVATLAKVP
jgi:hypothetical protein